MFTEVMPINQAKDEIHKFLDKKRMKPSRRETYAGAIDLVAEAMSLGEVVINDDGTITQKLGEAIGEVDTLIYKARVEPQEMVKAEFTNVPKRGRLQVYIREYTGMTDNQINRLAPPDWDTASCIALFFM